MTLLVSAPTSSQKHFSDDEAGHAISQHAVCVRPCSSANAGFCPCQAQETTRLSLGVSELGVRSSVANEIVFREDAHYPFS